ncbi:MAG: hypothetical protein HC899_34060 [Leptolyngbyaceae cyanobacterium SM1_4_3]|nr:hypothetical protein [Leptolyngbyaceae cyanobacterium SM1_4_3]
MSRSTSGNPAEITIKEFAEEIRALAGSKSEIVYKPLPQDDPKQRKPDITRAETHLGWQPIVPLQDGLQRTVADFRARLGMMPALYSLFRDWGLGVRG